MGRCRGMGLWRAGGRLPVPPLCHAPTFQGLLSLTRLTQLSLEDNGLRSLAGLAHLSQLMELYIGNNEVRQGCPRPYFCPRGYRDRNGPSVDPNGRGTGGSRACMPAFNSSCYSSKILELRDRLVVAIARREATPR